MNLTQELAAARDRVAHLEALAKREFLSPDATPAERVDFALKQPHMRQIGPNPLPDSNSLWDQFAHLKNYTDAGYTGYLDYKTFRVWLADFIVAATPGELRNRE